MKNYLFEFTGHQITVPAENFFCQHQFGFAKYMEGKGLSRLIRVSNKQIDMVNVAIAEMYLVALTGYAGQYLPYHRLDLSTLPESAQQRVLPPMESLANWDDTFQEQWRARSSFIYGHVSTPFMTKDSLQFLLINLNQFYRPLFGFKGTIRMQEKECFVLRHDGKTPLPWSAGLKGVMPIAGGLRISNVPIERFIYHLDAAHVFTTGIPVCNEVTSQHNISINVQGDPQDPLTFNGTLAQFGLVFSREKMPLPMMVIQKAGRGASEEEN